MARARWTQTHRRATLHADFRRDLHTRLFLSSAKQGFEDLAWLSDQDLGMLVDLGTPRVTAARQALEEAHATISRAHATGDYSKQRTGLDKTRLDTEAAHDRLVRELAPYLAEQARRRG